MIERARDRHTLLLAAGELRRAVAAPRSARPVLRQQLVEPRRVSGFSPAIDERQQRRSPRRSSIGSRLKNWKTKPMCSRRSRVSSPSSRRRDLGARDRHGAARSACRGPPGCASASTCRSRTGPSPPRVRLSSRRANAAQRVDRGVALAVAANDPPGGDGHPGDSWSRGFACDGHRLGPRYPIARRLPPAGPRDDACSFVKFVGTPAPPASPAGRSPPGPVTPCLRQR